VTPSLLVAEPVRPLDVVVLDSVNPGLGLGACRAGAQADSRRRSGGHKQLRRFASQNKSWGSHDLPPLAGIGICERGPDGLLAAGRVYDDVEAPVGQP
jgi:hypothetical protein